MYRPMMRALLTGAALASLATAARADIRQDQTEDLAAFRQGFFSKDISYPPSARAEAERRLKALEARAGQVDPAAFILELCRIAALSGNGHTTAFWPDAPATPLVFEPLGEDFYVMRAAPEAQDLLGARLVAIDGHGITELRAAERTLHGGLPTLRDQRGAELFSRPDLLHAAALSKAADRAVYRLRLPDGRTVDRAFGMITPAKGWPALPRPDTAPWAFQAPAEDFRWRDARELDAVVVQMRTNSDGKDRKAADFLAEAEAARAHLGRANVVLDMRWNPGGNFLLTRNFILAWPSKAPGRFYVLQGPVTFSAGIASIAYLKQAGEARVTLVGEPVGDRLNFFAEGYPEVLPHSKLKAFPATMRDDFVTGCKGYADCLPSVAQPGSKTGAPPEMEAMLDKQFGRVPLYVKSLQPDVAAPLTIADYLEGRDPGIEAVARLIRP